VKKLFGSLTLVVAFVGSGCPFGQYCRPTETRCQGNTVEICDSTEHWTRLMPCDEVGREFAEQWMCCEVSIEEKGQTTWEHTCLPASECQKGGSR
jgi:hypothetical protein